MKETKRKRYEKSFITEKKQTNPKRKRGNCSFCNAPKLKTNSNAVLESEYANCHKRQIFPELDKGLIPTTRKGINSKTYRRKFESETKKVTRYNIGQTTRKQDN